MSGSSAAEIAAAGSCKVSIHLVHCPPSSIVSNLPLALSFPRMQPLLKQRRRLAVQTSSTSRKRVLERHDTAQTCPYCENSSPQVYDAGWTCLVPECIEGFWQVPSYTEPLRFAQHFLCPVEAEAGPCPLPFSVQPVAPFAKTTDASGQPQRERSVKGKLRLLSQLCACMCRSNLLRLRFPLPQECSALSVIACPVENI